MTYNANSHIFTIEECVIYDGLMAESFAVCETAGIDKYKIGLNELFPAMGLETE